MQEDAVDKRATDDLEASHAEGDDLSAGAFRSLVRAFESIRVPLVADSERSAAACQRRHVKALIEHHISDVKWRELLNRAGQAAEHGAHEYLLLHFPSDACIDRGRAIVEHEPGWPKTLTGEAADLYRHWHDELRKRGFELSVRILEFPGGTPGDVGLFLRWQG
jgi:hypothetical protein